MLTTRGGAIAWMGDDAPQPEEPTMTVPPIYLRGIPATTWKTALRRHRAVPSVARARPRAR